MPHGEEQHIFFPSKRQSLLLRTDTTDGIIRLWKERLQLFQQEPCVLGEAPAEANQIRNMIHTEEGMIHLKSFKYAFRLLQNGSIRQRLEPALFDEAHQWCHRHNHGREK